jgi:hypothetical protein
MGETWSFASREEHTLRVFENVALRRIFGSKRDETVRGLRELHNEELHNIYFSQNIFIIIKSKMIKWAGHVVRVG